MARLSRPYPYLVTYDLKQPVGSYIRLFDELKRSPNWCHYIDTTWIVMRYEPMAEFGALLRPLIYQTDRLLVLPAKGPGDGWLTPDAWDWISQNLPREW
jgi:hypothetical protein